MAENNADPAYISINGKMQKFKLVKFKNDLFYLYSNGTYTLKVEFKKKFNIQNDGEDFDVNGVLMLYKAKKLLIKKAIIGGCSC